MEQRESYNSSSGKPLSNIMVGSVSPLCLSTRVSFFLEKLVSFNSFPFLVSMPVHQSQAASDPCPTQEQGYEGWLICIHR